MRKIMLAVVATCAVVAFIPASALAHGHKRHHHARVHHRTFGHDFGQSGSTSSGSTSSGQPAGTVSTFSGGVLTIALANGQTVSGMVTPDTEIECQAPDTSSRSSTSGTSGTSGWQGHDHGGGDQGQGNDGQGGTSCDTSALTQGAMVQEAELSVSSAGAVWRKVELQSTSSTASSSSGSSGSCNHH